MNDAELMSARFDTPQWAVEGLIPEGCTILAGKAKSGKSWLTLGLALSVVDGSPFLGRYPVNRGEVLYIGNEDSNQRMQKRLGQLLRGRDEMPTGLLHIETAWPSADEGGMQMLENWLQDFPTARLVVIDVMRRFNGVGYSYRQDSAKVQALDDFAHKYHVGIIAVFHMYKGPAISRTMPDWVDKIQGSVGVSGAASCIIGLARDRNEDTAVMRVVGKDVPEQDVALRWDAERGVWSAADQHASGDAADLVDDRQAVLATVESHAGSKATDVAALMGKSYVQVRALLWGMAEAGQLKRFAGRYYTPDQFEQMQQDDPLDREFAKLELEPSVLDKLVPLLSKETGIDPGRIMAFQRAFDNGHHDQARGLLGEEEAKKLAQAYKVVRERKEAMAA